MIPVARIALDALVDKLFSCKIDKDPSIRLSDWDQPLSKVQWCYAALDAYAHMFAYAKIMSLPHVDPCKVPAPLPGTLEFDDAVLLFTTNKQAVVASGTIVGPYEEVTPFGVSTFRTMMRIKVERANVLHLAATVETKAGKKSFNQLFGQTAESCIEIQWPLKLLRTKPEEAVHEDELLVATEVKMVAKGNTDVFDGDSDPAVNSETATAPKDLADDGEPEHQQHKGVKQDIAHIFMRFSRVLSKDHGAFRSFMARMSDAFFVPCQSDIDLVKMALRKAGLSEDEIVKK